MEQRAVMCFLILKGLRASAIDAELKSVYQTEELALSTLKKWRKCFAKGELRSETTQGVENPLPTT
jgi:hypothetical protein